MPNRTSRSVRGIEDKVWGWTDLAQAGKFGHHYVPEWIEAIENSGGLRIQSYQQCLFHATRVLGVIK